ncbi:MAG: SBBP repeat-containing protein [Pseudomonadota bacterium]
MVKLPDYASPVRPGTRRSMALLAVIAGICGSSVAAATGPGALTFIEPNAGQSPVDIDYVVRASGYDAFLEAHEVHFRHGRHRGYVPEPSGAERPLPHETLIRMQLVDAYPQALSRPVERLSGKSHYLRGADPDRWISNLDHYASVRYAEVYPGIDVLYTLEDGELRYDFLIAPGGQVDDIRLAFDGVEQVTLGQRGELLLQGNDGVQYTHAAPVIYQSVAGEQIAVEGQFAAREDGTVAFTVSRYDERTALVIDPQITLSTYFGGGDNDIGTDLHVAPDGGIIIVGDTRSVDLPLEDALPPGENAGDLDGYIARFSPDGQTLEFATYLGGSGEENIWSVALDGDGAIVVAGYTASADFPTLNAYQSEFRGGGFFDSDSFVTKLSGEGDQLVFSTYLGGADIDDERGSGFDFARDVVIDDAGAIYVTGETAASDFPATQALDGRACLSTDNDGFLGDGYLAKFDAQGEIDYAFCFGANQRDNGRGIAVAADGSVHVVGFTASTDFPVSADALQGLLAGLEDIHLTHFSADGTLILSSTLLGGTSADFAQQVRLLPDGSRVIAGSTESNDFPTTFGAFQGAFGGGRDALAARVSPDASRLLFSTYLGGNDFDEGWGMEVDEEGKIYLAASAGSLDFPLVAPVQAERTAAAALNPPVLPEQNEDSRALASTPFFTNPLTNGTETLIAAANGGQNRAYYFDTSTSEFLRSVELGTTQDATHDIAIFGTGEIFPGNAGIVAANNDAPSRVYIHDPSATPFEAYILGDEIRDSRAVVVARLLDRLDLSQDDIVLGNYLQPNLFFAGTGGEPGPAEAIFPGSESTATVVLAWGDLNGDGRADVIEGNDGQLNAVYFNLSEEEGFAPATFIGNEADPTRAIYVEDVDDDGDLDLAVGNDGAPNRLYLNAGDGTFAAPIDLDEQPARTRSVYVQRPLNGSPARIFAVDDQGGMAYTYQDGAVGRLPLTLDAKPVTAIEPTSVGNFQAGGIGAPLQVIAISLDDAYLTVLDPAGRSALFSTLLGGAGDDNVSWGLTLDQQGNAYVAGNTRATDFPLVDPWQAENRGLFDSFLTRYMMDDVRIPNRLRYTTVLELTQPTLDGISKLVLDWTTLACDESAAEDLYDLRLSLIAGQVLVDADTVLSDGLLQPLGQAERSDPTWSYDLATITLESVGTGTEGAIETPEASGVNYRVITPTPLTEGGVIVIEKYEDGVLLEAAEADLQVQYTIVLEADCDADGVNGFSDNCLYQRNPNQRDTDGDGIGNFCDADINNDCLVNLQDLALIRAALQSANEDADLNGDGVVNGRDLRIARADLFSPPGPSGIANVCSARP